MKRAIGRRRKNRANERGIALIMVMGAIAVLTVLLADFQDDGSAELASAMGDRDGVQAEYFAKSAINLSRLLIATEPTIRTALAPVFMMMQRTPPQLPVWQFSDRLLGAFNDAEGAKDFAATTGVDLSLGKNLGLPGGRFEVKIVDEDSKINANLGASNEIRHIRLAKQLLGLMAPPANNPLFEQRDTDGQYHDRMQICAAIIDWADPDENFFNCDLTQRGGGSGGAEDAYYQLLKKPFRRKNAPYDSLEELHVVRGVGEDFWATFVDPDPERPEKRTMTVWGQGAINVNTATAQTLLALVCSDTTEADVCTDPTQAGAFLTGVTLGQGVSMGAPMFGTPGDFMATLRGEGMLGPMLKTVGMKPIKFKSDAEFAKTITTESKMFSIYAIGIVKGYRRETRVKIQAVVDFRNAPPPTALPIPGQAGGPGAPGSSQPPRPAGSSPDAIAAALRPSTGGQIVYYRIE